MAKNELEILRTLMKQRGLSGYAINTSDLHGSEIAAPAFRFLEYVSGFSGSRGLLVVTEDEAGLWTDSRYFIQAESELEGTGIDLYKEGTEGVTLPARFLLDHLNGPLGLDGKMFSYAETRWLKGPSFIEGGIEIVSEDLASAMWEDRPGVEFSEIYVFEDGLLGSDRITKIRESMKEQGCNYHIMQSLDDIAWTLGLRGGDIPHVPVFYSYLVVGLEEAWLFAHEKAMTDEVRRHLDNVGVTLLPYEEFYERIAEIVGLGNVMLNPAHISMHLFNLIEKCATIKIAPEPALLLKAQKSSQEIEGFRAANILDGAAMCKFICWVKSRGDITEISASDKLREFRTEVGAGDDSFDTISAYAEHGAIVHYTASPKTDADILQKGFLLVDSGAHYMGEIAGARGTTDITRTIALGPLTDEMKQHYTLVLAGHIDYANAEFIEGTTLLDIDELAHKYLREQGLDYKHGTSHGIGHVLSVHESLGSGGRKVKLKPGMIMSDEPGVYIEGSHGIRIEGDLLCKRKDEAKNILGFEMLTLCPYEREAIIPEMLSTKQLNWLNSYHKRVREIIAPHLVGEELDWLIAATEKIG